MLVLAFKSQTLTRGESMGKCSFICADEVDKVFLECAFNYVPGVCRIRARVTTEGSERQKKGKILDLIIIKKLVLGFSKVVFAELGKLMLIR